MRAEGVLKDTKRNLYVTIDTYQGEAFSAFICEGYVRDETGKIYRNSHVTEVLDITMKIAVRLSELHEIKRLFHLDLSPENVYLVATGTRVIIPSSSTMHQHMILMIQTKQELTCTQ